MCALIGMAVYSTAENKKDDCLDKTLNSLKNTVDFNRHRLILSVNGYTEETKRIFTKYNSIISMIIYNMDNLGTASAINKCWRERKPGENAIKCDDDFVVHQPNWIDIMEDAIHREPRIGQIGLKRKDCCENPSHSDPQYRSELLFLPHVPGQRWIICEKVKHVMGTCVMHSSTLLDKVGYLYQPKKYGFDDVLMSYRSEIAGFWNVHLSSVEIDHIDEGGTEYQGWKERHAGEQFPEVNNLVNRYISGETPIYYNPFV